MEFERGDVVLAFDPFKDGSRPRPFLIVSDSETPFHGEQYIVLSLTSKSWYGERIPLDDDDWEKGGAPDSSSIMPWSINSIDEALIEQYQGMLTDDVIDEAIGQLIDHLGASPKLSSASVDDDYYSEG